MNANLEFGFLFLLGRNLISIITTIIDMCWLSGLHSNQLGYL